MNREKAIRDAFAAGIAGLMYNAVPVNVYDSVTTDEVPGEEMLYCLVTDQGATLQDEDTRHCWQCSCVIEIVSKQNGSVSRDIVDDVSEQIEGNLIYDFDNGLVQQMGWDMQGIVLQSVSYTRFRLNKSFYEITKILEFQLIITKL